MKTYVMADWMINESLRKRLVVVKFGENWNEHSEYRIAEWFSQKAGATAVQIYVQAQFSWYLVNQSEGAAIFVNEWNRDVTQQRIAMVEHLFTKLEKEARKKLEEWIDLKKQEGWKMKVDRLQVFARGSIFEYNVYTKKI